MVCIRNCLYMINGECGLKLNSSDATNRCPLMPDEAPINKPYKPLQTNYEWLCSLNIEEMAKYIFDLGNGREYCYGHCSYQDDDNCPNDGGNGCLMGVINWLTQPHA